MKLSPHFDRSELERHGPMPEECVPAYTFLCEAILEQIRSRFGCPIIITSGYRSSEHNQKVGGAKHSQHMATPEWCAADFQMKVDLLVVFDWIRLLSGLPFDQVILEKDPDTKAEKCIHVSWKINPRRIAGEGFTHGRGPFLVRETAMPPEMAETPEIWGEA